MDRRTLLLTADERPLFEALPQSIRNGWMIAEETMLASFTETFNQIRLRCQLMRIRDPRLLELKRKLQSAQSTDELKKLVEKLDIDALDRHDMSELFFGLGPVVITSLIRDTLSSAKTDDEVEVVVALAGIRHMQLQAFVPAYA